MNIKEKLIVGITILICLLGFIPSQKQIKKQNQLKDTTNNLKNHEIK